MTGQRLGHTHSKRVLAKPFFAESTVCSGKPLLKPRSSPLLPDQGKWAITAASGKWPPSSAKVSTCPAWLGASSSASAPAASLDSMPTAWLRQLILDVEPEHLPSLFHSCKVLRDLVLSQRTTRVVISLAFDHGPTTAAASAKLLLACKLSSKVKLDLSWAGNACDAQTAMSNVMTSAGHALDSITHVTLTRMPLDALVPPWLTSTCPNMTSLKLQHCRCSGLPVPPEPIPECPQLKELELVSVYSPEQEAGQLRNQLRALTGLKSFTSSSYFELGPCTALCAQLLKLCFSDDWLTDQHMTALLSMPLLKHLTCKGWWLHQSYTQNPCPWTHLQVEVMDIKSLGLLSLDRLESVTQTGHIIAASTNLAATNRAVAKLTSIQYHRRVDGLTTVSNSRHEGSDGACLAALMPLLTPCRSVCVVRARPVTVEVLAAMEEHLTGCWQVQLEDCTWTQEARTAAQKFSKTSLY